MKKFTPIKIDLEKVAGVPIPPPIILPGGDWNKYRSAYQTQLLKFETNGCSQISVITRCLEMYCNFLMATGKFSKDDIAFFEAAGYLDQNYLFSFSWEFNAILDGTSINGNLAQNAWKSVQTRGIIPLSMLQMTTADSQVFNSEAEQDATFYSMSRITPAMINLGQEFLKRVQIWWGWIGDATTPISIQTFQKALETAPIQFVLPIPSPTELWNEINVPYTGSTVLAHCDCCYKIDETQNFPYFIDDSYQPELKQLAENYYIPVALQGIILPIESTIGGTDQPVSDHTNITFIDILTKVIQWIESLMEKLR